jgi:hypothetical protein
MFSGTERKTLKSTISLHSSAQDESRHVEHGSPRGRVGAPDNPHDPDGDRNWRPPLEPQAPVRHHVFHPTG